MAAVGPMLARWCPLADGGHLHLSASAASLFGAGVTSVDSVAEQLDDEDAVSFRQAMQALVGHGSAFAITCRMRQPVSLGISGCPDPSDPACHLLQFDRQGDILAARSDGALTSLPRSPDLTFEKLLCAIEDAPFGFALYDPDDRLLFGNRIYRGVLAPGIADRLVGKTFAEIATICLENSAYADPTPREYVIERVRRHREADGMFEQFLADGTIERIIERRTASGGWVGVHVDVTEWFAARERATNAEVEAELMRNRLATTLDLLPDALIVYDSEDRALLANREYCQLYSNAALMLSERMRFEDVIRGAYERGDYGDPATLPVDFVERRFRAHRGEDPDFIFTMHSGKTIRIVERKLPDGGTVGLHVDLTAIHSAKSRAEIAEAEAKLAQERLQMAIEGMSDGFVIYDAEDRLVMANSRFFQINAQSVPAIMPGASFRDILSYGLERAVYKDAIGREAEWLAERLRRHQGNAASFDVHLTNGTVIRSSENRTPDGGHVGLLIDVTEMIRAREEAEAARQAAQLARVQLESAIRGMQDGFAFWDVDERLVLCNERYREIYPRIADFLVPGVKFEQLVRQSVAVGQHPEAQNDPEGWVRQTLEGWRKGFNAVELILPNGRVMRVIDKFERGIGTISLHVDITEIVHARQEAEAANRTKSMFLAQMSHEIRTPLTGILGLAQVLQDELSEGSARSHAENITRSGETLLTILNDVLDMAKIEMGRIEFERAPFDPENLAQRLAVIYAPQATERNLLFHNASVVPVKPRLGDAHRIMQIMSNLLSNALKFTPSGQVTFSVSDTQQGELQLLVEDTGIGMSQETVTRIFRPFEQADVSTTRRYGGTGLGMSIVHQLVSLMGGMIQVSSRPDHGTCVTVTLPLPEVVQAPPSEQVLSRPPESFAARVLVADDNSIIREILQTLLTKMGCTVDLAEDGGQAVGAFCSTDFDVVLLDISMPVMNGQEVVRAMEAHARMAGRRMPPCVAITANTLKHQVEEYLACGFSAHIAKPFRRADLETTLQKVLCAPGADRLDGAEGQPRA